MPTVSRPIALAPAAVGQHDVDRFAVGPIARAGDEGAQVRTSEPDQRRFEFVDRLARPTQSLGAAVLIRSGPGHLQRHTRTLESGRILAGFGVGLLGEPHRGAGPTLCQVNVGQGGARHRAVAVTMWPTLFPDHAGEMTLFGFVQHNFFVLFNAAIGLVFLRQANRELFEAATAAETARA